MVSRAKDTHTTNRVVRVPDKHWETLGDLAAPAGGRAAVIRQFIAWYVREPGVKAVQRPPAAEPEQLTVDEPQD